MLMKTTTTLRRRSWLFREWSVVTLSGEHTVSYDGRGCGYECVRVDGEIVAKTISWLWFVPKFEFKIGDLPARIDVRVWPWLALKAIRLHIAGEAGYAEGDLMPETAPGWARPLALVGGILLCDIFGFALTHTLPIVKFAPICATVSVLGFLAGVAGFMIFTGPRDPLKALCLVLATPILSLFILAPFIPAVSRAWRSQTRYDVKLFLADTGKPPAAHLDRYGGRYHLGTNNGAQRIVYSEGPDGKDDGGRIQVSHRLSEFDRPFSQVYPWPLSTLQSCIRASALQEANLKHRFDGDIVWMVDDKGNIDPPRDGQFSPPVPASPP